MAITHDFTKHALILDEATVPGCGYREKTHCKLISSIKEYSIFHHFIRIIKSADLILVMDQGAPLIKEHIIRRH